MGLLVVDIRPVSTLRLETDPGFRTLPGLAVPVIEVELPPGGPVDRMKSANSAIDSRASLGSLA